MIGQILEKLGKFHDTGIPTFCGWDPWAYLILPKKDLYFTSYHPDFFILWFLIAKDNSVSKFHIF